jgi:pentatricopeptide repeat protein
LSHRFQIAQSNNKVIHDKFIYYCCQGDKYKEAEAIFDDLLNERRASFKPDQKMFHMMIYMYKKSGDYVRARKLFAQMSERGIPLSTVTFNSLMSFETDYKEVSSIYDQVLYHSIAQ